VYELAHQLGVESDWVLATLRTMGCPVRSEENSLRSWHADRVTHALFADYESLVESGVVKQGGYLRRLSVANICTACGLVLVAQEIC